MVDDEAVLAGRKTKRIWLGVLASLPFLAAVGFGAWFFFSMRASARDKVIVDEVTTAAFACVSSVRGDAPESWGLERSLEHMSRMERVSRDSSSPPEERQRFTRLATDAARGCDALGSVMLRAREESPDLYFAVPAKLAQRPDQSDAERWFRRVLPKSRAEIVELARQISAMNDAINQRRSEHELMARQLPIEGGEAGQLARVISLEPLPRALERPITQAWPLDDHVLVLRRGSIARVPCETRYVNLTSCYEDFVQHIAWSGEAGPLIQLERPAQVQFWAAFGATPDGTLYAAGVDRRQRGVVGRWLHGETAPEIAPIAAPIDVDARVVAVLGGVALITRDGRTFVSSGDLAFAPAEEAPPALMVAPTEGGVSGGVQIDGLGTLTLFGSREDGWSSRFTNGTTDVLLRVIDANTRVQEATDLCALRSGRAVVLLRRDEPAADALVLTHDFGRTWLAEQATASAQ